LKEDLLAGEWISTGLLPKYQCQLVPSLECNQAYRATSNGTCYEVSINNSTYIKYLTLRFNFRQATFYEKNNFNRKCPFQLDPQRWNTLYASGQIAINPASGELITENHRIGTEQGMQTWK
jgi:hypothetical protein